MLEIKEVTKIYKMDEVTQTALDKVSINFRKNEFVSILGQSGSGKSTLLNIVGGLDHYTSGDLIINGTSTKKYTSSDWDTYRNHKVGFIFQSYNLIMHQTILSNVELALTLTGESKAERKKKAIEALKKVGLEDHLNKKPSQLSGGQMQRVAIARALINNPEIILADEPTGALDSETSVQIMDLLKEVAKEKLVIMVTHNPELAKAYSTRIVSLKDGRIIDDTMPFDGKEEVIKEDNKKRKSMGLFTALSLSLNNLLTKKGRTFVTAIAGSIGIIGIALVLALSNGVKDYVNKMQEDSFSEMAISIESKTTDDSKATYNLKTESKNKDEHKDTIVATDDISSNLMLSQKVTEKYNNLKKMKEYIDSHKEEVDKFSSDVKYIYNVDLNIYDKNEDGSIVKVNPVENAGNVTDSGILSSLVNMTTLIKNSFSLILNESNYEVISGNLPKSYNELVLVVNDKNEIPLSVMYSLNIENKLDVSEFMKKSANGENLDLKDVSYDFNKLIGKTYRLVNAADYYIQNNGVWVSRQSDNNYVKYLYDNAVELKIVGIAKVKNENVSNGYLGYTEDLTKYIMDKASKSEIVKQQLGNKEINVFTGLPFDEMNQESYENNLKVLNAGNEDTPYTINIYPKDANSKTQIKEFINNYNNSVSNEDKIIYQDQMESLTKGITQIVSMISMVMIAFVAISLVVSSLMIGIITYISVLERTKEIGILRAIGASKKDIKRVFRAETIIEGFIAGGLGIIVTYLLTLLVNAIVSVVAKIDGIMKLSIMHAIILILISILLTVIAGLGPAKIASKKDPVESLRSE
ncbi:MAG: ATP-binding cassette domain-containing protein [Bacilli bacterium]|nr:ATP-binding cassette domain-containing protein [Bacilli bacterium]